MNIIKYEPALLFTRIN